MITNTGRFYNENTIQTEIRCPGSKALFRYISPPHFLSQSLRDRRPWGGRIQIYRLFKRSRTKSLAMSALRAYRLRRFTVSVLFILCGAAAHHQPDKLALMHLLTPKDLEDIPEWDEAAVDYGPAIIYKTALLKKAYGHFKASKMRPCTKHIAPSAGAINPGWIIMRCLWRLRMPMRSGMAGVARCAQIHRRQSPPCPVPQLCGRNRLLQIYPVHFL